MSHGPDRTPPISIVVQCSYVISKLFTSKTFASYCLPHFSNVLPTNSNAARNCEVPNSSDLCCHGKLSIELLVEEFHKKNNCHVYSFMLIIPFLEQNDEFGSQSSQADQNLRQSTSLYQRWTAMCPSRINIEHGELWQLNAPK